MLKNQIKQILQDRGISTYRFWKEIGTSEVTAYRLVNDCNYIPGGEVLDKVCKFLDCQPGDVLQRVKK